MHFTRSPLFADTDVILWEGDLTDPTRKPPEMYTLVENFCLGLRRLELFARARSLRRGWVSVLAEGEEMHVPAVQAQARAGDAQLSLSPEQQLEAGTNALGQELSVDRAERWDQDKWETSMRAWLQNGRAVVPMTPGTYLILKINAPALIWRTSGLEVDALRPKSPMRGGGGGGGGGVTGVGNSTNMQPGGMVVSSGGMMNHHQSMPRGGPGPGIMRGGEQNNMLDMGGMGNMGMGMGMNPHHHHHHPLGVGMGMGMGVGMGMGMGVGMGWPAPAPPPMGIPMGMGMGMGMGMPPMGMVAGPGFDGSGFDGSGGGVGGAGLQMQMPMQAPGGQFHAYMDDGSGGGGMWDAAVAGGDGGMGDHEADGMANMGGGGMSGMGMGNMGMGNMNMGGMNMGMGGMGMGQPGQWTGSGY